MRVQILLGSAVALAVGLGTWAHLIRAERTILVATNPDLVLNDSALSRAALATGKEVFLSHCAVCHGPSGRGNTVTGAPDLTDNNFLYGSGRVGEIERIVLHGIHSGDSKGWNLAWMPAFGQPVPYTVYKLNPLPPGEIRDVVAFLRGRSGASVDQQAAERGEGVYMNRACWDCHGRDATGDTAIGAPSLVNGHWQMGDGSAESLFRIIAAGMREVCPAFQGKLDSYRVRAVSVYVASLHPEAKAQTHE